MTTVQYVVDVVLLAMGAIVVTLLLALARELGRAQIRLGPLSSSMIEAGPKPGDLAPAFEDLIDQRGRVVGVGGLRPRPQLVTFTSATCTTCLSLMPTLHLLAESDAAVDVTVISDGSDAEHANFLRTAQVGPSISYLGARHVGAAYQVSSTPYGVTLDASGRLAAKGMCNGSREVAALLRAVGIELPEASSLPVIDAAGSASAHPHHH